MGARVRSHGCARQFNRFSSPFPATRHAADLSGVFPAPAPVPASRLPSLGCYARYELICCREASGGAAPCVAEHTQDPNPARVAAKFKVHELRNKSKQELQGQVRAPPGTRQGYLAAAHYRTALADGALSGRTAAEGPEDRAGGAEGREGHRRRAE